MEGMQFREFVRIVESRFSGSGSYKMVSVKFEIYNDGKYWCARGIGEDIFTQGKTLDELMKNVEEASTLHFEEELEKGEKISILSLFEREVGIAKVASS
jgi:predicted RNase H-like HicB family nuclease